MTDDWMDERLRRAGADFRAATEVQPDNPHVRTVADVRPDAAEMEILDTAAPAGRSRPSRRTALIASAAAVAAALVAGGSVLLSGSGGRHSTSADAAGLKGTVWRLVGYGGAPPRTNSLSTLFIGQDGKLVADDECSVIGAGAAISGGQLGLTGHVDVRSRGCVDSSSPVFAGTGIDVLTGPATYSIDGDQLTLRATGQPTMHLVAAPHLPPPTVDVPTFVGATWRLSAVIDAKGVPQFVPRGASLRITDGTLTASDGCNTLSAPAQITGQDLQLQSVSSTEIGCTGSTAATAAVIDRFFTGRSLHGDVAGSTLNVKGEGVGVLTYEWVPSDPGAVAIAALTDREWVLTSIAGVPARALASLGVDARGPTSGTDGCTDIDATAEVRPGALTLTGVPTAPPTACTGAAAEQATTIDSILNQKPASWSVRSGKLIIYGGGAQAFSLVYETGTPPPTFPSEGPDPSVLGGRAWTLTAIETTGPNSSSGESSSAAGITLTFDTSASYRLTSRCGGQTGDVTLGRGTADFSHGRATGGNYCVIPSLSRATRTLAGQARWTIDKGQLRLTKGSTTLVFDPA